MKQNMIVVILLVTVATGAGGFFAGTKYQENKRGQFFTQMGNGQRPGNIMNNVAGKNGGRGGFRPVAGEIVKNDAASITVKLTDGSSKIILLTAETQINKAEVITKEDLTAGTSVAVFGTETTDGSLTAQTIQVNPSGLLPAPTGTK